MFGEMCLSRGNVGRRRAEDGIDGSDGTDGSDGIDQIDRQKTMMTMRRNEKGRERESLRDESNRRVL